MTLSVTSLEYSTTVVIQTIKTLRQKCAFFIIALLCSQTSCWCRCKLYFLVIVLSQVSHLLIISYSTTDKFLEIYLQIGRRWYIKLCTIWIVMVYETRYQDLDVVIWRIYVSLCQISTNSIALTVSLMYFFKNSRGNSYPYHLVHEPSLYLKPQY